MAHVIRMIRTLLFYNKFTNSLHFYVRSLIFVCICSADMAAWQHRGSRRDGRDAQRVRDHENGTQGDSQGYVHERVSADPPIHRHDGDGGAAAVGHQRRHVLLDAHIHDGGPGRGESAVRHAGHGHHQRTDDRRLARAGGARWSQDAPAPRLFRHVRCHYLPHHLHGLRGEFSVSVNNSNTVPTFCLLLSSYTCQQARQFKQNCW